MNKRLRAGIVRDWTRGPSPLKFDKRWLPYASPVTQSRLNVWQRIAPGMQGHRWIMHNSMALREEPAGFVELAAKVAKLEIKHVGLESIKGSGVS
eukprot:COSAG01_NODE_2360_length_7834_cov_29.886246_3_plen_95_part_00